MSVPVKNRKPNTMEYIKKGSDLYMRTINTFGKVEKTYPEIVGTLKALSNEYFVNSYMADKTYIDKKTTKDKFNLRQQHLDKAIAAIFGYKAQINLLYKVMSLGDSRFGNKKERDETFQKVADVVNEACKLILGVKESDKKRWEEWHPSKKQQNINKNIADKNLKDTTFGDEEDIHRMAEAILLINQQKEKEK